MTSVRLEWTLSEFYADGGVVSFTDRVAAALGIHASTIKTVAVFEGSVVVDFFIEAPIDNDAEENAEILEAIQNDLYRQLKTNTIDLGAPILDAMTGGQVVFGSGSSSSESSANIFDSGNETTTKKDGTTTTSTEDDEDDQTDVAVVIVTNPDGTTTRTIEKDGFKLPTLILALVAAVLVTVLVVLFVRFICMKKKNLGPIPSPADVRDESDQH